MYSLTFNSRMHLYLGFWEWEGVLPADPHCAVTEFGPLPLKKKLCGRP